MAREETNCIVLPHSKRLSLDQTHTGKKGWGRKRKTEEKQKGQEINGRMKYNNFRGRSHSNVFCFVLFLIHKIQL